MQTTLYATYETPEKADEIFVDLLERGVSLLDLVVITRHTYQGQLLDPNGGRLGLADPASPQGTGHDDMISGLGVAPVLNWPPGRDPFEETADGICLLDQLEVAGDLASCLRDLGFSELDARNMENRVLQNGAILILRVPSGSVTNIQGLDLISKTGGELQSPQETNPFLM